MFDECLYFNTVALARVVEKAWRDVFAPFGLTPAQAFCLRAVLVKPISRPSELADTLEMARATVTRALDQLERKGMITRRPSSDDQRETVVVPTKAAKRSATAINAASGRMTERLKTSLGTLEFQQIVGKVRAARAILS
jgi:DNA-binding MarR family transcriptional regulator